MTNPLNEATNQSDALESPAVEMAQFPRRHLIIIGAVAVVALVAILSLVLWSRSRQTRPQAGSDEAKQSEKKDADEPQEVVISPEALKAAGIEVAGVTQRPAVALLTVTGAVETNQQQTQQVTPLVGGRVERVNVVLGDRVKTGMVLATIASPEVAEMRGKLREAQTKLQLAQRNLQRVQRAENRVGVLSAKAKLDETEATLRRTRRLIELGVGAGKDLIAAEAAYKTAKAEYDFQNNISLNRKFSKRRPKPIWRALRSHTSNRVCRH